MTQMLPFSCDPGYGELGVQEGVSTLRQAGGALRHTTRCPPIDLPSNAQQPVGGVVASPLVNLPANSQAFQAYTAIGQYGVQDTALQNAMVAAGIANGGVLMTPAPDVVHPRLAGGAGADATRPKVMATGGVGRRRRRPVTSLMEGVVANGTASGVGFPVLPVRRRQDGDGADRRDAGGQPRLDDRLRAGQQPPGRGGGRRARSRTSRPTARRWRARS